MTAVDRPDNGQDEGMAEYRADFWRRFNAARAGAGEQQREQVASELVRHHQLLGPRDDAQPDVWFNWCECGWDGGPVEPGLDAVAGYALRYRLHVADELLALLGGTQPDAQ